MLCLYIMVIGEEVRRSSMLHIMLEVLPCMVVCLTLLPVEARLPFKEVCIRQCKCDEILLRVNCTHAYLKHMPDIATNTRALILDHNMFTIIEEKFFQKLTSLRLLSIEGNHIDDIEDGSFRSQRKVMRLNLRHNQLGEVPLALKHMKALIDVDLSFNRIGVLTNIANIGMVQEPWSNMTNLQELRLDYNALTLLPVLVFSKLVSLTYLSITHNHLVAIPDGAFNNLIHLEVLMLSHNNLTGTSFSRLTSYNNNTSNRDSRDISQETNLIQDNSDLSTSPTLEIDYVADNNANGITTACFHGNVALTSLHLQDNLLQELLRGIFQDLNSLDVLHLESNQINYIQDGAFDTLINLRELHLHENDLKVLPMLMFEPLRNLARLNLNRNSLTDLSPLLSDVHLFHLTYLDISGNRIKTIADQGFTPLTALVELHISNNLLDTVPMVTNLQHLTFIDLHDNRIREIYPLDIFSGTHLEIIDLRENALETVLLESFHNLEYLQILRLAGSKFVCDCRLQWVIDQYYDGPPFIWMGDSTNYPVMYDQFTLIKCNKPRLYYDMTLREVKFSPENHRLSCTEYIESHKLTILLGAWGGVLGFFLLIFWMHTFFDFKRKFGVRRPKKRYMALYYAEKLDSNLVAKEANQMTFRTFDSDSEGADVVDEETTV